MRKTKKFAWVAGVKGNYNLCVSVEAGDYASLDYVGFKTYRVAQDVANFINAQCRAKVLALKKPV